MSTSHVIIRGANAREDEVDFPYARIAVCLHASGALQASYYAAWDNFFRFT
jgi:hypothetical protein